MKFLELFDSRDKKTRLSHIRNLLALALIDGSLEDSEMKLIFKIGIRSGLQPEELNRIFERPDSISFVPPNNFRDRIEQLYDMVMVMMVDGEIHPNEIGLCKVIAIRLGFHTTVIDKIIQNIIESIAQGIVSDIALSRLMKILDN